MSYCRRVKKKKSQSNNSRKKCIFEVKKCTASPPREVRRKWDSASTRKQRGTLQIRQFCRQAGPAPGWPAFTFQCATGYILSSCISASLTKMFAFFSNPCSHMSFKLIICFLNTVSSFFRVENSPDLPRNEVTMVFQGSAWLLSNCLCLFNAHTGKHCSNKHCDNRCCYAKIWQVQNGSPATL